MAGKTVRESLASRMGFNVGIVRSFRTLDADWAHEIRTRFEADQATS